MLSGIAVKVFLRNNRAGARLSITKESPYKTSNSTAVFLFSVVELLKNGCQIPNILILAYSSNYVNTPTRKISHRR